MTRYLVRRAVRNVLTLFFFVTALFFILESLPGDYTHSFILTPEQRAVLQESLGLNQPIMARYWGWLKSALSGGLGWSLIGQRPVRQMIGEYLPGTLLLFLIATTISMALGMWLGKLIAWRRGRIVDTLVSVSSMWLYTSFPPLIAFLLVQATKGKLGWQIPLRLSGGIQAGLQWAMFTATDILPSGEEGRIQRLKTYLFGAQPLMLQILLTILACLVAVVLLLWLTREMRRGQKAVRLAAVALIAIAAVTGWALSEQAAAVRNILYYTALPLFTLVAVLMGEPMLLMRTTMMESMRDEYVTTAQAKGLPDRRVRDQHAARTALLPVVSRMLLSVPFALTGSLVIETIFSWPGLGSLLLYAVDMKDYAVVLGILIIIGFIVVLSHMLLDILNLVMDPRVRSTARWQGGI